MGRSRGRRRPCGEKSPIPGGGGPCSTPRWSCFTWTNSAVPRRGWRPRWPGSSLRPSWPPRAGCCGSSDAGCGHAGQETTAGSARRRTQIEFYRRFETLLARRGIAPRPGQTQREFAAAAGAQLALLRQRSAVGRPARRRRRRLLSCPFRPPAPRQRSGPGGRTCH